MRGALFSILLAVSTYAAADSSTLKGVWQIASSSYDDQAITLIEPRQIKLFTSDRVFYTYYPAQEDETRPYLSVGHGRYRYTNGSLTEVIDNHSSRELIGQTFEVEVSVSPDGNSFTQIVDLGKYVLNETWVRLE